ncbi:MAG: glycoside hydrolase family 36 protein [Lentisphaeria bacterium]|jgi:alpha-galactosidase
MNITVNIKIDGKEVMPGDDPGVSPALERHGTRFRARFVNHSGKTVKLDWFRFSGFEFAGAGQHIRVYREGWTAVSAVATRRFGECDLRLDPNYMQFAVSSPEDYSWQQVNSFSAENAVVLNHAETGRSLLIGFITTARFYNRFQVELADSGLKTLDAYVLGDGREVDDGEEIISEEFIILEGNDGYGLLEEYARLWGEAMQARFWDHIPTGWCSWYYYFSKITEADVLENLEYLRRHREEYPLEYFQIDDGYQRALGDWTAPSTQFPHGIESTIKQIMAYGFKPGLWFAPFMVEANSDLYRNHPEYLLRNASGEIIHPVKWRGHDVAVLDATRPDVQQWLKNLFATVRKWGCAYVKLDFMMYESCVKNAVYADRKATRCDAFRRGLQAIRDGLGDDAFILGGTVILGPSVGLVNAARYATDITPYWRRPEQLGNKEAPAVPNVVRNLICRRYMHQRLWINDPDVHIARRDNNKLTEDEVILWTSALYLVGGALLLSDRFSTLDAERAALSKMLLSEPDAFENVRPEDFFEREIPAIWTGIRKRDQAPAIALFNLYDEPLNLRIDLTKLNIPAKPAWTEFWSKSEVKAQNNVITLSLKPHTAKLLF